MKTSQLSFRTFHLNLMAARLVPNTNSSSLPSPIGKIEFIHIANLESLGLYDKHPLEYRYPGLNVQYYAMVIADKFLVERNGIRGVALYADYNQTKNLWLSITSENGRNPLAPWNWSGEPGSLTDPAAQAHLEWRTVTVAGKTYPWHNAAIHGWHGFMGENAGLDWRDGIPESVETMYDPQRSRVVQSIMVPVGIPGIGVAEQTIKNVEEIKETYSILLFRPKPRLQEFAEKIDPKPVYRSDSNELLWGPKNLGSQKVTALNESREEKITPEFKMAAGGFIIQHVLPCPFSPLMWESQPEALLVCFPVTEDWANKSLGPDLNGTRKIF